MARTKPATKRQHEDIEWIQEYMQIPEAEVMLEYGKYDFEYDFKTGDQVKQNFWAAVLMNDNKTPIEPLERKVTKIVRTKDSRGNEFVYFNDHVSGFTHGGNVKDTTFEVGRYEFPIFNKEFDEKSRKWIAKQIQSQVWRYKIPFSKKKLEELLGRVEEGKVSLHVELSGKLYNVADGADFLDGTFSELVEAGRTGQTLLSIRNQRSGSNNAGPSIGYVPDASRVVTR